MNHSISLPGPKDACCASWPNKMAETRQAQDSSSTQTEDPLRKRLGQCDSFQSSDAVIKPTLTQSVAAPDLWPHRSQAQEVVPRVFVTNYFGSRNLKQLHRDQITHIVVCAGELPMNFPEQFRYLRLEGLADNTHAQLRPHLARVFAWVTQALEGGGRVLFHCASGVSRSPAVLVAYLMWDRDVSLAQALAWTRTARPIVSPNEGFLEQLRGLEPVMHSIVQPAEKG